MGNKCSIAQRSSHSEAVPWKRKFEAKYALLKNRAEAICCVLSSEIHDAQGFRKKIYKSKKNAL